MAEREYIVTLNENVDVDAFKVEMIADNMDPYVPQRPVHVANDRPASKRNTHYLLTDAEAEELRSDPRVFAVELEMSIRDDLIIGGRAKQESVFTKTTNTSGDNVNWGLRRMVALSNPFLSDGTASGDYTYTLTGEGVDVVIMDSGIQSDHPEFTDSAGLSRVQEIDWYAASGIAGSMPAGHYTDYDGHGTHVAGIVAGKTYGWAKNSRIYAVKLAGLEGTSDPNDGIPVTDAFDIIKEWHKRKKAPSYTPTAVDWTPSTGVMELTIGLHSFVIGDKIKIRPFGLTFSNSADDYDANTAYPRNGLSTDTGQDPFYNVELSITAVGDNTITVNTGTIDDQSTYKFESAINDAVQTIGVKNKRPTIVNMSWGYFSRYQFISGGNYRGTAWSGSARNTGYGMTGVFDGIAYRHPIRVASVDTDMDELIEGGVNVVVAAGNSYHKVDVEGGVDYDNYYTSLLFGTRYYHRGASPFSKNAIIVGNIDSELDSGGEEQKAVSSETGPGVDVYAPGTNIFSATSTTNKFNDAPYPSNNSFRIANISGTSMAAPQIAGLLAQYGEISPTETPKQFKVWAEGTAKADQINTNGNADNDYTNYRSLMGGVDKYGFQEFGEENVVTFAGQETIAVASEDITPTYTLTSTASAVDEGQSFTITLQTTNVVNGTIIPFTITGVTSADISDASLVDNFIVGSTMQKTYTAAEDNLFDDGNDTFRLTLNDQTGVSIAVTINDTSKPDPIYTLTTSSNSVEEGSSFTITATAQNVLSGTVIPYTISGIETEDIGGEPLTGNLTVPTDLTRTYTFTADGLEEGQQTMTFTWSNQSVDIVCLDTSQTPITYTLSPSVTEVDEGDSFTVTISTDGGLNGTQLPYTITGVSSVDISNQSLTGSFTIGSDMSKTFNIANDTATEGEEVFLMTLDDYTDVTASVTINDTSTTQVTGQERVTNAGGGTFTVPSGVTSISLLAVGGGGGAGTNPSLGAGQIAGGGGAGAVAWLNNVTVTPGQEITYNVGAGGVGRNAGGDTTVTISGTTYTAGGGQIDQPVEIALLAPYELEDGGLGGTATGAWTGSVAGGKGGSYYKTHTGQAIVGGGAGGSGTGGVGQTGFPNNVILDPRNSILAPGSFSNEAPRSNNKLRFVNWSVGGIIGPPYTGTDMAFRIKTGATDDFLNNADEQAYYLRHRYNEFLDTLTFGSHDKYYFVFRDSDNTVRHVQATTDPSPSASNFDMPGGQPTKFDNYGSPEYEGWQFTIANNNAINSDPPGVDYDGTNYTIGTGELEPPLEVTKIELRGGAATGANDTNTTLIGSFELLPQGNLIANPNETAASGGGHGYVEDWQSGTGIVVGGRGGSTSLTKGLSNTKGAFTNTTESQTINGAGVAFYGGNGVKGNTVTSETTNDVGAGAGGVMVMGLAPSGQQTRSESGQAGGLLIVWPGTTTANTFKAPSYTLNTSKTNCDEGSTFTITCANNLTENTDKIPYTITGVSSSDINNDSLTNSFTALGNSETFTVSADGSFEGNETFNLELDNGADDVDVTINDTSDGTQDTFTANITNSGASAYLFSSASDRNGTVSGSNPNLVIDRGDTISWTVNASGHPFYIKDVQGTGTSNQTSNVTGQGTTNGVISYTPGVDGRKYYQCSSHNDMHGEIYICDDHWMTLHEDSSAMERDTWGNRVVALSDNSTVVSWPGANNTANVTRYTKHGSPVWNKSFNVFGVYHCAIAVDSTNNVYIAWHPNESGSFYYIQKLNSSGQEQWGRKYTPDNGNGRPSAMTINANGDLIVTGQNEQGGYLTNSGGFVTKISTTNGDVIANSRIPISDRKTKNTHLITDSSNNVFVAGWGARAGQSIDSAYVIKFDTDFTLQWQRWYHVDQPTYLMMVPRGITLDHLGNPVLALGTVADDSASTRQHIIRIASTTGTLTEEFELDASNRATYKPEIKDITYDSVNNEIVVVGTNRLETASGVKCGFAKSFNLALSSETHRQWRATNGSYVTEFMGVAINNTLNPMNRLAVMGRGNTAKSTTVQGLILGSIPFQAADVDYIDTDIEYDEWRYTEQGSIDTVSNSIVEVFTTAGESYAGSPLTAASGTGQGTLNTALTGWDQQKMALFWGTNTEDQEVSDPTYSLAASQSSVNEGQSFTVTLTTTNVPNGTNVPYTITGVSSADIGGVSLTGNFTILNGSATVTINVTADNLTD